MDRLKGVEDYSERGDGRQVTIIATSRPMTPPKTAPDQGLPVIPQVTPEQALI